MELFKSSKKELIIVDRYVDLTILDMIKNKRCTLIDEFSYSIHQIAMNLILRIYIALTSRSQLIITTQTIALLLNKRLRRDIIRICTKNEDGETQILKVNQAKNTG